MTKYTVKVYDDRTEWYLGNRLHRNGAPALEYKSGSRYWYMNGHPHREDGPACEYYDGEKRWFLNGEEYSEEEYSKEMQKRSSSCAGKVVEVDGKRYKLMEL